MYRNIKTYDKNIEIGGKEVLTYMELLKITSKMMHKKRLIFSMPTLYGRFVKMVGQYFWRFQYQFCFTTGGKPKASYDPQQ